MPREEKTRNESTKLKRYVSDWANDDQAWRLEAWIINRLVDLGGAQLGEITRGPTTFASRRERIRECIVRANLAAVAIGTVGKTSKSRETFGSIFAKFYREPLTPGDPVCSSSSDARPQ